MAFPPVPEVDEPAVVVPGPAAAGSEIGLEAWSREVVHVDQASPHQVGGLGDDPPRQRLDERWARRRPCSFVPFEAPVALERLNILPGRKQHRVGERTKSPFDEDGTVQLGLGPA